MCPKKCFNDCMVSIRLLYPCERVLFDHFVVLIAGLLLLQYKSVSILSLYLSMPFHYNTYVDAWYCYTMHFVILPSFNVHVCMYVFTYCLYVELAFIQEAHIVIAIWIRHMDSKQVIQSFTFFAVHFWKGDNSIIFVNVFDTFESAKVPFCLLFTAYLKASPSLTFIWLQSYRYIVTLPVRVQYEV